MGENLSAQFAYSAVRFSPVVAGVSPANLRNPTQPTRPPPQKKNVPPRCGRQPAPFYGGVACVPSAQPARLPPQKTEIYPRHLRNPRFAFSQIRIRHGCLYRQESIFSGEELASTKLRVFSGCWTSSRSVALSSFGYFLDLNRP